MSIRETRIAGVAVVKLGGSVGAGNWTDRPRIDYLGATVGAARRRGRAFVGGLAIACVALAASCLRTSVLVDQFNGGVLDTGGGDPRHDPKDLRRESAVRRIGQELIDGYFGQASPHGRVVGWLADRASDPCWYIAAVGQRLCEQKKTAKVRCEDGQFVLRSIAGRCPTLGALDGAAPDAAHKEAQSERVARIAPYTPQEAVLCDEHGALRHHEAEVLADTVRFRVALRRAIDAGASFVDEGQIPLEELADAAGQAFGGASRYLGTRKWARRIGHPIAGLVVKGGASTGIFSAGAVWVALNMAYECMKEPQESITGDSPCGALKIDPRFAIMSGTSTGAIVSSAVDIFNAAERGAERERRLRLFQQWFVCAPSSRLYCSVDGYLHRMVMSTQMSMLEFDGLKALLKDNLSDATRNNRSELVLNVVDFRTGRYYAMSDQNPAELASVDDVVNAAIASAALPVIVKPEPKLPSNALANEDYAYLDGGIRSELPIGAAIRRGAERLLVVSSDASVIGEAPRQKNALDVLVRYIGVSTGGVLESETEWAPRLAESQRLAELTECMQMVRENKKTLCEDRPCNPVALCTADWKNVCRAPGADAESMDPTRNARDVLAPVFHMTSIYRDDRRVPGLAGYVFRETDQRKLFLAGAEEARQRCFEIAEILGLPTDDEALRKKLVSWCTPSLPPLDTLCESWRLPATLRSCSDPVPPLPDAGLP
jgi:predicted acylesterase/phospholipase RssA